MKSALLVVALVLSSCIPHAEPHAVVQVSSSERRAALERAAAKWNTIVRDPVRLDGGEWRIVEQVPPDYASKGFIGETDHPGRVVYIMPGLDPAAFYAVALHELGHVIGLHHVQGERSVMHATFHGATEFTEEDLEECRVVGACGLSPLDEAKCRTQGACGEFPNLNR